MRLLIYINNVTLILAAILPVLASAAIEKEPEYVTPTAWTVSEPLGLRYESTVDTLFENYHAGAVPSLLSKAWATTGNYGAEGQNQIFFERKPISQFFFADAQQAWLPSLEKQKFYNSGRPITLLSYTTGGDKYSNQDRTTAIFSGNANKKVQVGAMLDYIYSKGSYDYQAVSDFAWGLSGSYTGDRYELQAYINNFNYLNKENGGIVDNRYITDPAAVQGGETRVNTKDIPTELTAAHSKLTGVDFYMNHRYKVGHWHYDRDSVTDTIVGRTYVPVTSFTWTMGFKMAKHRFINKSGLQDTTYFANTYLGLGGTDENTRYNSLRNTVGVSLLEGFNRYAKFGLSAFATHELRKYHQVTDSVTGGVLPEGLVALPVDVAPKHSSNLIWIGGQLTKQRGSVVTYGATAQFGVAGDVAGDIDIAGDVATRFQLFGDTVSLKAYGYFKNLEAPYLLKNYVSNHYAWQNSFSKETRFRVGGELTLPFTGSQVNVGYETLKNYFYFGADATPQQHSSPVHVLSATLKQRVNVAAFYWDTDLTLQTTTNDEVLPLPKFAVYSNVYFKFLVANVLYVQLGVDGNYYTSYYAPGYNPATMTFHNQRDMKCGDFAFMNLYANFNLKQARFYVMYSHANKGLFGKDNYFSVPHYPLNPARFLLGVSVRFVN